MRSPNAAHHRGARHGSHGSSLSVSSNIWTRTPAASRSLLGCPASKRAFNDATSPVVSGPGGHGGGGNAGGGLGTGGFGGCKGSGGGECGDVAGGDRGDGGMCGGLSGGLAGDGGSGGVNGGGGGEIFRASISARRRTQRTRAPVPSPNAMATRTPRVRASILHRAHRIEPLRWLRRK